MSTLQTSRATGARDGAAYLESLRDGREVWLTGERVSDVPSHPAFRGVATSMALTYPTYDLAHAVSRMQRLLRLEG